MAVERITINKQETCFSLLTQRETVTLPTHIQTPTVFTITARHWNKLEGQNLQGGKKEPKTPNSELDHHIPHKTSLQMLAYTSLALSQSTLTNPRK